MSKSLGNVLLPEQVINGATPGELQRETEAAVEKGILSQAELEKSLDGQRKMFPYGIKECGTDSLRFTLLSQNIKQHSISFDVAEAFTNKKFFNKIFHSTKFAAGMAAIKEISIKDIRTLEGLKLSEMDRWLLSRLGKTVKLVKESMDNYNFYRATAALKSFFYGDICDVYIETVKSNRLKDNEQGSVNCKVLNTCLTVAFDYLELFAPFFTKEIKPYLAVNCVIDPESYVDDELEKEVYSMLKVCESIRELKSVCRITAKIPSEVQILIKSKDDEIFFATHTESIKSLTFSSALTMTTCAEDFEREDFIGISTAGHLCSFGVRTLNKATGKVDIVLNQKKFAKLDKELFNLMRTVNNEGYKEKAAEKVQKKHKERIEQLKIEIENIRKIS